MTNQTLDVPAPAEPSSPTAAEQPTIVVVEQPQVSPAGLRKRIIAAIVIAGVLFIAGVFGGGVALGLTIGGTNSTGQFTQGGPRGTTGGGFGGPGTQGGSTQGGSTQNGTTQGS